MSHVEPLLNQMNKKASNIYPKSGTGAKSTNIKSKVFRRFGYAISFVKVIKLHGFAKSAQVSHQIEKHCTKTYLSEIHTKSMLEEVMHAIMMPNPQNPKPKTQVNSHSKLRLKTCPTKHY